MGTYTQNTVTGQLMNETEFMSKCVPASNAYSPDFKVSSKVARIPRADLNRDKSPKSPLIPIKRDDSPSPASYKDADVNWKKQSNFPSSQNFSVSKQPRKSYLDIVQKEKKNIPEPGKYKDDMKKFDLLSHGPSTSIPHYKRGR